MTRTFAFRACISALIRKHWWQMDAFAVEQDIVILQRHASTADLSE